MATVRSCSARSSSARASFFSRASRRVVDLGGLQFLAQVEQFSLQRLRLAQAPGGGVQLVGELHHRALQLRALLLLVRHLQRVARDPVRGLGALQSRGDRRLRGAQIRQRPLGNALFFAAIAQLLFLPVEVQQPLAARALRCASLLELFARALLLGLRAARLGEPRGGLRRLPPELLPRPAVVLAHELEQLAEPIDLFAVRGQVGVQLPERGALFLVLRDRTLVLAGRTTGGGQQQRTLALDPRQYLVTRAARHLAQTAPQRRLQVLAGEGHRLLQLVPRALLDPQQARNPPVLGPAGAAAGELEAEQPGEPFLGLLAAERAAADLQIAALLAQEALDQPPALAAPVELERDARRRRGIAPRLQVLDAGGLVTLEERRADRAHQRALARLVGTGEQVDAIGEVFDAHRLAELAELLDADAAQFHQRTSPAARSPSSPARITSASRASASAASA